MSIPKENTVNRDCVRNPRRPLEQSRDPAYRGQGEGSISDSVGIACGPDGLNKGGTVDR